VKRWWREHVYLDWYDVGFAFALAVAFVMIFGGNGGC
jgi:hypothetical protein